MADFPPSPDAEPSSSAPLIGGDEDNLGAPAPTDEVRRGPSLQAVVGLIMVAIAIYLVATHL